MMIPKSLAAKCAKNPQWLSQLPEFILDVQKRWSLALDDPFDGDEVSAAWVAPARRTDGTRAVLKIGMPHFEGLHEIEGLRFWNGDGAVRVIESDNAIGAMLLERCEPGTHLRTLPEEQQDDVIASLLRRLWRPPDAASPFRPLSALVEPTAAARELLRTTPRHVVLATDLHAGNVLLSQRGWLMIDPKPFVGDPAYDATQHLLNCRERLQSDFDGVTGRFADLLGIDRERVRRWTAARLEEEKKAAR